MCIAILQFVDFAMHFCSLFSLFLCFVPQFSVNTQITWEKFAMIKTKISIPKELFPHSKLLFICLKESIICFDNFFLLSLLHVPFSSEKYGLSILFCFERLYFCNRIHFPQPTRCILLAICPA